MRNKEGGARRDWSSGSSRALGRGFELAIEALQVRQKKRGRPKRDRSLLARVQRHKVGPQSHYQVLCCSYTKSQTCVRRAQHAACRSF